MYTYLDIPARTARTLDAIARGHSDATTIAAVTNDYRENVLSHCAKLAAGGYIIREKRQRESSKRLYWHFSLTRSGADLLDRARRAAL